MVSIHSPHDGPVPPHLQRASAKINALACEVASAARFLPEDAAIGGLTPNGTRFVSGTALAAGNSPENVDPELPVASAIPLKASATGGLTPPRSPILSLTPAIEDLAAATAAVLDLNMQVAHAEGLDAAGRVIVEQLALHLKLDRVAFAWRRPTGACSLMAISGLSRFDQRSELVELLHATANEAVSRQADGFWPPLATANRHSLLAHRKLAELSRVEAVATYRLTTGKSSTSHHRRTLGVLLVTGSRAAVHDPANIRFLATAAKCLSATLDLTVRAEGGFARRSWTRLRRAVSRRVFGLLTACAVAIVVLMAVPWPYRISCRCVVEPMQRRFVVAPHDGLIEMSLVQPGDVVRAGQPFARVSRWRGWMLAKCVGNWPGSKRIAERGSAPFLMNHSS